MLDRAPIPGIPSGYGSGYTRKAIVTLQDSPSLDSRPEPLTTLASPGGSPRDERCPVSNGVSLDALPWAGFFGGNVGLVLKYGAGFGRRFKSPRCAVCTGLAIGDRRLVPLHGKTLCTACAEKCLRIAGLVREAERAVRVRYDLRPGVAVPEEE